MATRKAEASRRMAEAQRQFRRWRRTHGGPGRRLPRFLWEQATQVALVAGVEVTARELRVNATRLGELAEAARSRHEASGGAEASNGFVEVDGATVLGRREGQAVLRFVGRGGARLRIDINGASTVDAVAMAQAFWERYG